MQKDPSSPDEIISGIVERVTYHNPENGFAVIRVKVRGHKDLVTIIGHVPSITPGEYIKSTGLWYNDKNHGLQFKASFLKALPPNTLEGIEKYLGSGLIQGIGVHFAKRLVAVFKEDVFDIIEHKPELLSTVEGIGKIRSENICKNWKDQKIVREIMIFLQSHGVSTAKATRIYKTYGANAIKLVSENPYRLAKDIYGIGFISADKIAANIGIESTSLIRARAGISHTLLEATSNGHCCLPKEELIDNAVKLLDIDSSIITEAINKEAAIGNITIDTLGSKEAIFLTSFFVYEKNAAMILSRLKNKKAQWHIKNVHKQINAIEDTLNITLADAQKNAIDKSINSMVTVITGGPGTGKTTIINSIVKILIANNLKVKLCAPTGRAAKRLSESTGQKALTIHRMLEFDPKQGKFKFNEEHKLKCNYLIIDEASMVDVQLFYSILKAMDANTALLIVGDIDQLPSVGAGAVLKDIIESNNITTVQLVNIYRQAKSSNIITTAHLVNKGIIPPTSNNTNRSDYFFITAQPSEDITNTVIKIVRDRIPKKFGFHSVRDIQVLCPMQRGGAGSRSFNIELQKTLNPNYHDGIDKFGQKFAVNDKVMQTENNYNKDVFNGDLGLIKNIDHEEQTVIIDFDDREVEYTYSDLDQITLAYSISIHKSQGSEYPAVVIPLTMQSFMMLRRNLIYTAITRGKKLVIIVGEYKAMAIAVKNKHSLARYTKLYEWLTTIDQVT